VRLLYYNRKVKRTRDLARVCHEYPNTLVVLTRAGLLVLGEGKKGIGAKVESVDEHAEVGQRQDIDQGFWVAEVGDMPRAAVYMDLLSNEHRGISEVLTVTVDTNHMTFVHVLHDPQQQQSGLAMVSVRQEVVPHEAMYDSKKSGLDVAHGIEMSTKCDRVVGGEDRMWAIRTHDSFVFGMKLII
jgi:hypothetical protein